MSYQTVVDNAWEDKEKSMIEAVRKIEKERLFIPKAREVTFDI